MQEQQKKYDDIDFTPPADVQEEAQRGLDWRAEHGRGGTEVGVARGRDLSNGVSVSPETIRRMVNYLHGTKQTSKAKALTVAKKATRQPVALRGRSGAAMPGNGGPTRFVTAWTQKTSVAKRSPGEGESLDDCLEPWY